MYPEPQLFERRQAYSPPTPPPERPPRSFGRGIPGLRRILAFRDEIRRRLAAASALEGRPPEHFGFSLATATRLFMVTGFFYRHYFRVECHGIEALPTGPILLVANHGSHSLSWDGAMIVTAGLLATDPPRLVHGMADHRLMELPILGAAARRIGAVDGTRPACASLLRAGAVVLTFPEGVRALSRPFRDRYRLCRFGQGFMHVALATRTPIVPVAVIGCEEEAPLLANPPWLARLLRTPTAPITPTLFVPLPVKYRIHFGAPLYFRHSATPHAVARSVDQVHSALQGLIDTGLALRPRLFF
jgi:1-acyl-sn-glycerol-3-phosphate acyltransferase